MTRLLMIGAGVMGAGYVEAARRRGFEVGLVERERWHKSYRDRVDRLFACPSSSDQFWIAAARDAARTWQPDLILPFAEPQVLAAAWLQDRAGLPGPGLRAATASRDKALQRALGAATAVPQPEFALARDLEEALEFARHRYPVVVKALRSTGSRGVVSVASDEELRAATLGWSGAEPVLVESRVDGPEFSCELLVRDGEILFENLTQKTTSGPPEFVEVAHRLPVQLGPSAAAAVRAAVRSTIAALEVRTGLVHTEFRLVGDDVAVLETALRSPGDHIMELLGLAYGIDFYDAVLALFLGQDVPTANAVRVAGIDYLAPGPGVVDTVDGVDDAAALPGVHRLHAPYRPGDVVAPATSSGERGGYVIATGSDEDALGAVLRGVAATLDVRTNR